MELCVVLWLLSRCCPWFWVECAMRNIRLMALSRILNPQHCWARACMSRHKNLHMKYSASKTMTSRVISNCFGFVVFILKCDIVSALPFSSALVCSVVAFQRDKCFLCFCFCFCSVEFADNLCANVRKHLNVSLNSNVLIVLNFSWLFFGFCFCFRLEFSHSSTM